jgi:proteasome beta subunit
MDIKKGTTTVGLVYKDGVILAADRRATAGTLIVDKKAEKVNIITDDIAVTLAGGVADAQLLMKLLRAEVKLKTVTTDRAPITKEVANLLGGMIYSNIRKYSAIPGVTHFLLGGRDKNGVHMYDLFPDGSVTKIEEYTSSGSGSVIAYGVLETQYKPDLSESDAVKLAIRCVNAALQRDSASGNGIDVVKVTADGAERIFGEAIEARIEQK